MIDLPAGIHIKRVCHHPRYYQEYSEPPDEELTMTVALLVIDIL
jgi:hypothetical protein